MPILIFIKTVDIVGLIKKYNYILFKLTHFTRQFSQKYFNTVNTSHIRNPINWNEK